MLLERRVLLAERIMRVRAQKHVPFDRTAR
jgi:hypothetical protein